MQKTIFWPESKKHLVHTVELNCPESISAEARNLISQSLHITEALRQLQDTNGSSLGHIEISLRNELSEIHQKLSSHFTDKDTIKSLELRSTAIKRDELKKTITTEIAGLDEKELVCIAGKMSTWIGKSKETYYSAIYGIPNAGMQSVSDTIDKNIDKALTYIRSVVDDGLILLPGCSYKIIDLFAISGEANCFPKHFAYFVPEDEGVKYADMKRTIVFSNTYLSLFERISKSQCHVLGFNENDLPSSADVHRHLVAWFRGHDIGHSIVRSETKFSQLSKQDRWGSMVVQEALADVFGLLICLEENISKELNLAHEKLANIYVLEMLRYLRRGPCDFPDAGAAYIQLKFLMETGCIKRREDSGTLDFNYRLFYASMKKLAAQLSENILTNSQQSSEIFMKLYCPHRNLDSVTSLMTFLGYSVDTLAYKQSILG